MGGRYINPLETLHFDKNWQIGSYNSGGCLPCGGVEQQRRSRVASHIFFFKDKKKISDNNNNKDASIVMMWNLHAMRQTPPMGESSCCTAVSESPLIGLSGREKTPKLDPAQQGKKGRKYIQNWWQLKRSACQHCSRASRLSACLGCFWCPTGGVVYGRMANTRAV